MVILWFDLIWFTVLWYEFINLIWVYKLFYCNESYSTVIDYFNLLHIMMYYGSVLLLSRHIYVYICYYMCTFINMIFFSFTAIMYVILSHLSLFHLKCIMMYCSIVPQFTSICTAMLVFIICIYWNIHYIYTIHTVFVQCMYRYCAWHSSIVHIIKKYCILCSCLSYWIWTDYFMVCYLVTSTDAIFIWMSDFATRIIQAGFALKKRCA